MSDSPIIAFLNKLADLILLNVIWLICCIPIVTIGASTTAMYYVCIISIRNGDGYVVKRFFKSFKENFVQATVTWLIALVIDVILAIDLLFWYKMGSGFSKIMFVLSAMVAMLIFFVELWVFPVMCKLQGNFSQTIVNAAKFAFGYLPQTMIIVCVTAVFVTVNILTVAMNAISLFVGFAVLAYVQSFFYYHVFMKHIDEKYDDFWREDTE